MFLSGVEPHDGACNQEKLIKTLFDQQARVRRQDVERGPDQRRFMAHARSLDNDAFKDLGVNAEADIKHVYRAQFEDLIQTYNTDHRFTVEVDQTIACEVSTSDGFNVGVAVGVQVRAINKGTSGPREPVDINAIMASDLGWTHFDKISFAADLQKPQRSPHLHDIPLGYMMWFAKQQSKSPSPPPSVEQ